MQSTHEARSVFAEVSATHAVAGLRVRRFGTGARDLEIDFDAPRPLVVTGVLTAALGPDDDIAGDVWWTVPVHARIALALAVAELATGQAIEVTLPCACGETASLDLTAAELLAFSRERAAGRIELDIAGFRVRIPVGRDQLHWLELGRTTATDAELARGVLSHLAGGVALADADLTAIERALAEADPLVDFQIDSSCPDCGAALHATVDLEAIALGRLRRVQRTLIEEVHVLASAYHWTEAQIVALPAWRRGEYLALAGRGRL